MKASKNMDRTGVSIMWVRKLLFGFVGLTGLAMLSLSAIGDESLRLEAVDFTSLSGDQLRMDFTLSGPAPEPVVFHTDKPARIAMDLLKVSNGLGAKTVPIDTGVARSVNAVEAQGRTRVVVNLTALSRYDVKVEGNHLFLTLHGANVASASGKGAGKSQTSASARAGGGLQGQSVKNVDFARGEKGEGRVQVTLTDANAVADMRRENGKIVVYLPGTAVPAELEKKLDVADFATPVKSVETIGEAGRAKITVTPANENYDYSSYQTNETLTVEFRAISVEEREAIKKKETTYSGEKLTLNFQDIPVRQVLQILADFTGLNIVASDAVQGNVTLRLNDVPWDQALDIVLKAKDLAKRQEGNVVRIGPAQDVRDQEQKELEANQNVEKLEPLKTELIPIKYARAADIVAILKGGVSTTADASRDQLTTTEDLVKRESTGGTSRSASGDSILSERGSVSMDDRTNTLLIKDTPTNLEKIRQLIDQLDVAVRQVLIEARIVIAQDDFTRDLGMRFTQVSGGSRSTATNNGGVTPGANPANGTSQAIMGSLFDLAAADPRGKIGFTILRAAGSLLDLELSAGQLDGKSETLSNPRLLTSDGTKAVIKQGRQIPYATRQGLTGAISIQFKEAMLMLEVTPHITPDDNVVMDLLITKDEVGKVFVVSETSQIPSIDKRELSTSVQVGDGDTVVLGGVYEDTLVDDVSGIPFLSEIPYIGKFLQKSHKANTKRELLVFLTPQIIRKNLSQNL